MPRSYLGNEGSLLGVGLQGYRGMVTDQVVHSTLLIGEIPFAEQIRFTVPSMTFDPFDDLSLYTPPE